MSTRREFLKQTAAAGIVAAPTSLTLSIALPAKRSANLDKGPRIKSVIRSEETTLRLGGNGDNFYMSWAADDRQVVAVCDSGGWSKNAQIFRNSRLWAISGSPQDATFHDVPDDLPPENCTNWNASSRVYDRPLLVNRRRRAGHAQAVYGVLKWTIEIT